MTADHLNPLREGAAADAAERAGENFMDGAAHSEHLIRTHLGVGVAYADKRREAAQKLAEWLTSKNCIDEFGAVNGKSFHEFIADKIFEAMK